MSDTNSSENLAAVEDSGIESVSPLPDALSGMLVHPACLTPVRVGSTAIMSTESRMRMINRLRNTNPAKLKELTISHLSYVLDLNDNQLESFLNAPCSTETPEEKPKKALFGKRKASKDRSQLESSLFGAPLAVSSMDNIMPLIDFLRLEQNIVQEGLFRKSGNLNRQAVLKEKLNAGEDILYQDNQFNAHDVANLLKTYLKDLPEPLIQERYYPAYCQVLDMVSNDLERNVVELRRTKQLQAVQLLLQLLPRENLSMLEALLDLLHHVVEENEDNKMSASALGTLLGPCILVPKKMTGIELQTAHENVTKVMSYMIVFAEELFKVPDALVADIEKYWQEMEECGLYGRSHSASLDESDYGSAKSYKKRVSPPSDALSTTVAFADRTLNQQNAAQMDTEIALAQLYAHVNSMPESAKKKQLLKQFNKASGKGTPSVAQPKPRQRTKSTTKSIGESIKKAMSRNHKRRGSQHDSKMSTALSTLTSSSCASTSSAAATQNCTDASLHTPVIRRAAPRTSPAPQTPVMKLCSAAHPEFKQMLTPGCRKPMSVLQSPPL